MLRAPARPPRRPHRRPRRPRASCVEGELGIAEALLRAVQGRRHRHGESTALRRGPGSGSASAPGPHRRPRAPRSELPPDRRSRPSISPSTTPPASGSRWRPPIRPTPGSCEPAIGRCRRPASRSRRSTTCRAFWSCARSACSRTRRPRRSGGHRGATTIDIAMRHGVNYPRGPLAWADAIGLGPCSRPCDQSRRALRRGPLPRVPLLRRKVTAKGRFRELNRAAAELSAWPRGPAAHVRARPRSPGARDAVEASARALPAAG